MDEERSVEKAEMKEEEKSRLFMHLHFSLRGIKGRRGAREKLRTYPTNDQGDLSIYLPLQPCHPEIISSLSLVGKLLTGSSEKQTP